MTPDDGQETGEGRLTGWCDTCGEPGCLDTTRQLAEAKQERDRLRGDIADALVTLRRVRHFCPGATDATVSLTAALARADETARTVALAPTLAEAVRRMEGALRQVAEHLETCRRCGGKGLEPGDRESACSRCGGQGQTLDATGSLPAVEDALTHPAVVAALAVLKGVA